VFICVGITYSSAQEMDQKYINSLTEMFELKGTDETYKVAVHQMINMFKNEFNDLDDEILEELETEFLKTSIADLTEMLAPVYFKPQILC